MPCLRIWWSLSSGRCSDRCRSFEYITARQGCALARICPHCAALVEPSAKIHLPDLRADRLFPKVGTLARRSLVCSVLALHFSELEHGPTFWGLGAYRRDVPDQLGEAGHPIQVHMKPLVPRRDCPQDEGQAGITTHGLSRTVPLLGRIRKNGLRARLRAEAIKSIPISNCQTQ